MFVRVAPGWGEPEFSRRAVTVTIGVLETGPWIDLGSDPMLIDCRTFVCDIGALGIDTVRLSGLVKVPQVVRALLHVPRERLGCD